MGPGLLNVNPAVTSAGETGGHPPATRGLSDEANAVYQMTRTAVDGSKFGKPSFIRWGKWVVGKLGPFGFGVTAVISPVLIPASLTYDAGRGMKLLLRKIIRADEPLQKLLPMLARQVEDARQLEQLNHELGLHKAEISDQLSACKAHAGESLGLNEQLVQQLNQKFSCEKHRNCELNDLLDHVCNRADDLEKEITDNLVSYEASKDLLVEQLSEKSLLIQQLSEELEAARQQPGQQFHGFTFHDTREVRFQDLCIAKAALQKQMEIQTKILADYILENDELTKDNRRLINALEQVCGPMDWDYGNYRAEDGQCMQWPDVDHLQQGLRESDNDDSQNALEITTRGLHTEADRVLEAIHEPRDTQEGREPPGHPLAKTQLADMQKLTSDLNSLALAMSDIQSVTSDATMIIEEVKCRLKKAREEIQQLTAKSEDDEKEKRELLVKIADLEQIKLELSRKVSELTRRFHKLPRISRRTLSL
ncbi:hypothetical protein [Endozoicomonas sp. ONNA2]|uniref:hypothetical protein n=1 Tax=Endozoicomonas sp. ONNA2 TaxID=2828741 RepID=UPI002147F0C4|nr:hypothetical protein [Endozoicomonas sp. ONNA2]